MMEREFITPQQAAEMFGVAIGTLANMRYKKEGPAYFKAGARKVVYSLAVFRNWIQSQPVITKDSK